MHAELMYLPSQKNLVSLLVPGPRCIGLGPGWAQVILLWLCPRFGFQLVIVHFALECVAPEILLRGLRGTAFNVLQAAAVSRSLT